MTASGSLRRLSQNLSYCLNSFLKEIFSTLNQCNLILDSRDRNGKQIRKWLYEISEFVSIRFFICFHLRGWKLEGNRKTVIRDISHLNPFPCMRIRSVFLRLETSSTCLVDRWLVLFVLKEKYHGLAGGWL